MPQFNGRRILEKSIRAHFKLRTHTSSYALVFSQLFKLLLFLFTNFVYSLNIPFILFSYKLRYTHLFTATLPTMMNINNLPIDCLILIFQKFSLQSQINLREVCCKWKEVIEQICQQKYSLKLFGRSKNITDFALTTICDNYRHNDILKLKPLGIDDDLIVDSYIYCDDLQIYQFFTRIFAKIKQLSVHFCWDSPFSNLDLFLRNCHSLTSLTLCGAIDYSHSNFTARLCEALNLLPSLKRLDLNVIDLFLLEDRETSQKIEMPKVMSQLKHFSICNYKGDLVSVLKQLNAENCKLLRLDLPRDYDAVELMENIIKYCSHLVKNLTHFRLSLPDLGQANKAIGMVCGHFKALKSLDFQCCSFINFEMVIYKNFKY